MPNYIDFDHTMWVIEKMLFVVGLRGAFEENKSNKRYFFLRTRYIIGVINVLQCTLSTLSLFLLIILRGEGSRIIEIADSVPTLMGAFMATMKSLNMYYKRNDVSNLLKDLRRKWPKKEECDEFMLECINGWSKGLIRTILVSTILEIGVEVLYILMALWWMGTELVFEGQITHYRLPYYEEYPFEWRNSYYGFAFAMLTQVEGGIFAVCNNPCTHGMQMATLVHMCIQCQLLGHRLQKLERSSGMQEKDDFARLNRELGAIMHDHNEIYQLAYRFQDIFGTIFAFHTCVGCLIICQVIFTIVKGDPSQLMKYLVYLSALLLQLLLPCWYAECLIEQTQRLSLSAYSCDWWSFGQEFSQKLVLMQARAQRPAKILAVKLVVISIGTFISILRTTWSFFAVLRTMFDRKN